MEKENKSEGEGKKDKEIKNEIKTFKDKMTLSVLLIGRIWVTLSSTWDEMISYSVSVLSNRSQFTETGGR